MVIFVKRWDQRRCAEWRSSSLRVDKIHRIYISRAFTHIEMFHDLSTRMKMSRWVDSISSWSLRLAKTAISIVTSTMISISDLSMNLINAIGIHKPKFKWKVHSIVLMEAMKSNIYFIGSWSVEKDILRTERLWICAIVSCEWAEVGCDAE